MKINRKGVTRIVFEFNRVVVKIPNFLYSWQNFLQGMLANIHEGQTWRYTRSQLLCPVLWTSWGGWILVMQKVDRCLQWEEWDKHDISEHRKQFEGDDTVSNYGILNNKLVKIDYGQ